MTTGDDSPVTRRVRRKPRHRAVQAEQRRATEQATREAADATARAEAVRAKAAQTASKKAGQDPVDRKWRELTGAGKSQVSLSAALRARDANQPTAAELAQAERDAVIQRRNWVPGN